MRATPIIILILEVEDEVPILRRSTRFQLRIEPGDFVIRLPVSFTIVVIIVY